MAEQITVLYTYNLGGALERFPRVATALRRLRGEAEGQTLLLDAGNACDPSAEPCALTDGRAAPILLDAMGYDAANVSGYLTDAGRAALRQNYLNVALVDEPHPYISGEGLAFASVPPAAQPHRLHIAMEVGTATGLSDGPTLNRIYTLTLGALDTWAIGRAVVEFDGDATRLLRDEMIPVALTTRPDATIAGAVDFVRDEVRLLKKTRRT